MAWHSAQGLAVHPPEWQANRSEDPLGNVRRGERRDMQCAVVAGTNRWAELVNRSRLAGCGRLGEVRFRPTDSWWGILQHLLRGREVTLKVNVAELPSICVGSRLPCRGWAFTGSALTDLWDHISVNTGDERAVIGEQEV